MSDDAAVYGTNFEMLCDVNTQIMIYGRRAGMSFGGTFCLNLQNRRGR
jgi:hypothetical protein